MGVLRLTCVLATLCLVNSYSTGRSGRPRSGRQDSRFNSGNSGYNNGNGGYNNGNNGGYNNGNGGYNNGNGGYNNGNGGCINGGNGGWNNGNSNGGYNNGEMEDITMEMVAGTMVSVTVDVQIPTMEVVADQTQIMEMDGTMAIIMDVQILDNKSKNIKLIFRQLRPKTLNPQNDEVVCQTSILLSDKTLLTMILH